MKLKIGCRNWKLEIGNLIRDLHSSVLPSFKFQVSNFTAKIQNQSTVSRDKLFFSLDEGCRPNLWLYLVSHNIKEIHDLYLKVKSGLGTPEMDLAFGTGSYKGPCACVACLGQPFNLYFFGTA